MSSNGSDRRLIPQDPSFKGGVGAIAASSGCESVPVLELSHRTCR